MSTNALARLANSIPVRWGYFTKNRLAQKVIFIGHEKAIYDADGTRLDSKLSSIEDSISDAFSEGKDYVVGDYCIYLNALYKFTAAKPAGAWDGSKVVPVSVSQEIANLNANLISRFRFWYTNDQHSVSFSVTTSSTYLVVAASVGSNGANGLNPYLGIFETGWNKNAHRITKIFSSVYQVNIDIEYANNGVDDYTFTFKNSETGERNAFIRFYLIKLNDR